MKRKVLSVMLCAAMVVSMTACGGSDAKENTASANASVSETEQGEATEQDAQEEEPITCTLTVWSPSEDQDPEYGQEQLSSEKKVTSVKQELYLITMKRLQ